MNKIIFPVLRRCTIAASLFIAGIGQALHAAPPKRVLFIGNSITYFNDMPQVFKKIADQKGDSVALTVYAPGGTGFQHHYIDSLVFNKFREGNWDVIVLQPGSSESLGVPPTQPRNLTLQQGSVLIDSALRYSPCAHIMFYEISYGVYGSSQANIDQYNAAMGHIRTTINYLSDATGLSFAPVGEAIRYVWNENPAALLWGSAGDIHPNIKGSYIASCVFYASIFWKPSAGSTVYNGNTAANALYYQQVADSVVLQHATDWRADTLWHKAAFSFDVNQTTVQFQNQSHDSDSLKWYFDAQNNSNVDNPFFIFSQPGIYPVKLIAYFGECSDTAIHEVTIGMTNSIDYRKAGLDVKVYPNPITGGRVQLELPEKVRNYTVRVIDCSGKQLILQQNTSVLNLTELPPGLYFLRIEEQTSGKQFAGKIIKL